VIGFGHDISFVAFFVWPQQDLVNLGGHEPLQ
jgi:hypothetical protein